MTKNSDFFDSHAHLHDEAFEDDRKQIIAEIQQSQVKALMTVGDNIENSEKAALLAKEHPFIFASLAIHPHHAAEYKKKEDLPKLKKLMNKYVFHAFGEVGLDFHYGFAQQEEQIALFKDMLEFWSQTELPLIIHNRKSENEMIPILKEYSPAPYKGVIHCFDADIDTMQKFIDLGFHISFSGMITFKKADLLRKVVAYVPLDKLLIETDCPYLSPHPFRGKRNNPLNVKYVAEKVALIKELSLEEIAYKTTCNALNLYNIKSLPPEAENF